MLLDDHGRAKLGDVGLARALRDPAGLADLASRSVLHGTWGYMDPEYVHTGHYGPRSDVYALGKP